MSCEEGLHYCPNCDRTIDFQVHQQALREAQAANQDVLLKLAAALERVADLETYKAHHKTNLEYIQEICQEITVERRVNSSLRERLKAAVDALELDRDKWKHLLRLAEQRAHKLEAQVRELQRLANSFADQRDDYKARADRLQAEVEGREAGSRAEIKV